MPKGPSNKTNPSPKGPFSYLMTKPVNYPGLILTEIPLGINPADVLKRKAKMKSASSGDPDDEYLAECTVVAHLLTLLDRYFPWTPAAESMMEWRN